MRKGIAVVALIGALLLSGCSVSDSDSGTDDGRVQAYVVPLPDGGSVVCAVYTRVNRGGLSCDWEGKN